MEDVVSFKAVRQRLTNIMFQKGESPVVLDGGEVTDDARSEIVEARDG